MPEELTEAEKEVERARLAESAKAKPAIGLPVKPVSLLAQMREVLVRSPFWMDLQNYMAENDVQHPSDDASCIRCPALGIVIRSDAHRLAFEPDVC